jgi:hypothetical protein
MANDPAPKLKRIPVTGSSESPHITPRKRYKVKIDGVWHEGQFSKQWFGWQFDGLDPAVQLNLIDEVYELPSPPRR